MEKEVDDNAKWQNAKDLIKDSKLSVLMPSYNLGHTIAQNIDHVVEIFSGRIPFEVIVVDDGSSDDSASIINAKAKEYSCVKPVVFHRNKGKGTGLKRGFEVTEGDYVLLLDGDLDLPPSQASRFFDILKEENADVVIGSKMHPESQIDYPAKRRLYSFVYYSFVKLMIGLPVKDTQTGIKLFKREVLEYVIPRMLVKHYAFDLEVLSIAHEKGFKVSEAPIQLVFKGGNEAFGPVGYFSIKKIILDTLAIFYRIKVIKYYKSVRIVSMPDPLPMVSIVIAMPSVTEYVDECLDGIAKQTYKNFEVILLPDVPSGREWPAYVREIVTGAIRPAEKRNIGIDNVKGEITAFIDDDATPTMHWLHQAVQYFSDPNVGGSCGPATTPPNDPYMAKMGGRIYANYLLSGGYIYRYFPTSVQEVDDYPTCNLLIRTDILKELGGYRTDFWPGEDTYLCRQVVKEKGYKIIYDPYAEVFHHRRKLFLPHLRQMGRYALHRGYFARKFPSTSRKISYLMPTLLMLGTVLGPISFFISPILIYIYVAVIAFYLVVTFLGAFSHNFKDWVICWIGIVLSHYYYGFRFLIGFFSKSMPETKQIFDHPSEGSSIKN
ncbi:MAG: glycosyltransferase [Kiritimatiellae bacterium]|jgi:glycosyltransferase involved in cell wall biosynthesis|nr:glycosyltransferase [Kiritimatiellia bacterium]